MASCSDRCASGTHASQSLHRYLAPWRAFAAAGGKGVMTSHNSVLGQPMHANDYVTNAILRREYRFARFGSA